jgi:hypothetical protein
VDDAGAAVARHAMLLAVLLPSVPGDVFTTADARRWGMTQRQLEWAVRSSKLHRLRRGALCSAEVWAAASPEERLVLRARAFALGRNDVPVFSHRTAAALHGLPVGNVEDATVWVTVPPKGRTGSENGVVRQAALLDDDEIVVVQGLHCTTPARTVADCLRHLDALLSVPIGDAALGRRPRLVTPDEIEAAVARHRWPRAAAATALLPLLDGRRESPVESRSAVVMHRYDLPRPAVQARILDERGRFVGRPDFLWLEQGVVGEADGLVKYDGEAGAVVAEERARQARLQALGLIVVRWTEQQLYGDPPLLVQQLRAALAAGRGGAFRGRVA